MRKYFLTVLVLGMLLAQMLSACTQNTGTGGTAPKASVPNAAPAMKDYEDFDRNNFGNPTTINHKWYPFAPGTTYIYEGATAENGEVKIHRVEMNVTDLTKEIDGVRTLVNYILDISEGLTEEAELAFFAQDNAGNVWRMGEHPEVYENGALIEAPTWISGVNGAHAGIAMLAKPELGTSSYSQGWGPEVEFTDRGQVFETGQSVCTPLDCFENVIVIKENSKTEPDAFQFKYYAPGNYNIRVDWKGVNQKQEILELVAIKQLSPEELATIRTKAIELEKSAYQVRKEVYGQTPPMEPLAAVK